MAEQQKPTELDVEFKGQTANDGKAGIGIKIECGFNALEDYALLLVGAQLQAELSFCPSKHADTDGQQTMDGADITIAGVAECKGISVKPDHIKAKLTFVESAIEVGNLAHLAGKKGHVRLTRIGDVGPAEKEDGAE